jgi:putative ABC transport system permease protein
MIMSGVQIRSMQSTMIDTIIALLVVMSIVIAAVGGLGLMGTMSMNVMERTKEIAVMRSFGASDKAVLRLVLVEGVLIGLISWLLGIIFAFPITILLNNLIGTTLMRSPLDFVLSLDGFFIWFIIVVVISALASALPARNASRMTIREALAYE